MHTLKQFLSACVLFALLVTGALFAPLSHAGMSMTPGTPVHTHSDANTGGGSLALSGTLSSTKACASGYTRTAPNYCANTASSGAPSVFSTTGTCTQSTALSGVTDAKAVFISVDASNLSANAVGQRQGIVFLFPPTDTTCTTNGGSGTLRLDFTGYEHSAVAAGTTINAKLASYIFPSNSSGQIYVKSSTTNFSTGIRVVGYFD